MSDAAISIQEIDAAIAHAPPARRAKMLVQLTSLFVERADQYSDDEIGLFDNVIARLAGEIETEARILLSERLAPVPNAPPRVIRMLAFDDHAEVAAPVLTASERLDEKTLIENAGTKSQAHLLAISHRKALGEALTDVLIRRGDRAVAVSVAANPGARLSESGVIRLVDRSTGDDELTERLGTRREIPPHLFLKLLAAASERVRVKLRAQNPQAGQEVDRVVAQVAGRMKARAFAEPRDYAGAIARLGAKHHAGKLSETDIAELAHAEEFENVVVALALLANLPVVGVEQAMQSERPDVILIVARASGLTWPTAKAVLRLRAGPKGISATELQQHLASFEQLSRATAERLVEFHRTAMSRTPSKPH